MKGKRVIAGILLAEILAVTLAGCKNIDNTREETEKPVITLGSDNYPPYNYLNEDGVPTGIDVELATEAFKRKQSWSHSDGKLHHADAIFLSQKKMSQFMDENQQAENNNRYYNTHR